MERTSLPCARTRAPEVEPAAAADQGFRRRPGLQRQGAAAGDFSRTHYGALQTSTARNVKCARATSALGQETPERRLAGPLSKFHGEWRFVCLRRTVPSQVTHAAGARASGRDLSQRARFW